MLIIVDFSLYLRYFFCFFEFSLYRSLYTLLPSLIWTFPLGSELCLSMEFLMR